jgi:hypothetical protein
MTEDQMQKIADMQIAQNTGNPYFDAFLARQRRAFPGDGANANKVNWMLCHWPENDSRMRRDSRG